MKHQQNLRECRLSHNYNVHSQFRASCDLMVQLERQKKENSEAWKKTD